MDPLTHTLLGITLAKAAGASGPYEIGIISATVGGALIADSDFVIRPLGSTLTIRFHHGPTHSLVCGLLLSALCAAIAAFIPLLLLSWWKPSFFLFWAFAYLGFLSHVGLDLCLHCNGLQVLWPFNNRWFRWPLFIGLNPLTSSARCAERSFLVCSLCQLHSLSRNRVFYILIGGIILQTILWSRGRWVALGTFLCLILYVLYAFYRKRTAKQLARDTFTAVEKFEIFPADFSTGRWLALGKNKKGYEAVTIDLQRSDIVSKTFFQIQSMQDIDNSLKDERVKNTLRNYIVPYETVKEGDNGQREIFFWDLAYYFTPEVTLHMAKVRLNEAGKVESIDFRERW
ncbi:MAG: metal-dependent hydrolase [Thermodesulfobacteriota bacterium]|nr:metal-dependent hydrolase [Thermodesulfobacteriota bacterium]